MKLSELYTTKDVEISFPTGKSLNIKYDPSKLTPKLEAELRGEPNGAQVAELVKELVVEWDLEDGGVAVPLTEERVNDDGETEVVGPVSVPLIVLGIVLRGITKDISETTGAEGNS